MVSLYRQHTHQVYSDAFDLAQLPKVARKRRACPASSSCDQESGRLYLLAIKEMYRQVGDLVLDEHGAARRGLLVRHLVMPGGLDETRAIVRFLAREVSPNTFVNVMPQYRPEGLASQYPAIAKSLKGSEFRAAVKVAHQEKLRLAHG
jgi:uncharacterized Fe-S radical SAM superfamily protein PflX